ncbi:MAG TPA: lysophospholipid acyltransferase family protein [Sandaracinaceae bacterium]
MSTAFVRLREDATAQEREDAHLPPAPARSFEKPTLADLAISAGLWTAGLAWLVPSLGAMTLIYKFVPAHRVDVLGRIYCRVQIALTGCRWRAVVHPKIDPNRPYIFAQNHTNHFDHVMLYNATPHYKQGLELESHFRYPFYGWFMKARGTIPVKKGQRGQTSELVERIRKEIAEGRSILAFPEGTRTRTGRVQPFRKGIFYIARDLGVPIVPVAVTGTFDLMRPGSLVLRPGNEITVYCEEPVETAGLTDAEIPALADRVRNAIRDRIEAYWAAKERKACR